MLGVTDYPAFVVAFIIFLLIPGPGNLVIITSTTKGGLRGGFAATIGIILGDQVLSWMAVAGLAAVLAASPVAFEAVQWVGAIYLVWLGAKMVLAKPGAAPVLNIKPYHYLRQAMVITLFNPKAIVFYMAFFPLFVDPVQNRGLVTFAFLAATIAVLAFLYGVVAILLTHFLAERLRSSAIISLVLEKIAGLCLIGFGLRLALSR
ncbi:MAG: LysE family transporter [Burkholderiaceae bacterium]|jgi:threonine/homoserine/homoserine lactone efflux protein|nr:LysE family transporter [Burkholderiaceae bacterium]